MNMPTRIEKEILTRLEALPDPVAECARRFPWWTIKVRRMNGTITLEARWMDGMERGLQHAISSDTEAELHEAERMVALQALLNAEYRKVTR